MLDRYFAVDLPFWRFLLNTLAVSCLGLFPLLLLYVGLTPGFGPLLMGDGMALTFFLRQVVTNGIVVVFTVNFFSFFLYAATVARFGPDESSARILVIDPPLRALTFILLHGLIYFFSADWFGSFGGDHWLALRVVAPTLVRSALFANLSGVYLYATLGSALPVYTVIIDRFLAQRVFGGTRFGVFLQTLPKPSVTVFLALAFFAVFPLLVTAITAMIALAQST